MIGWLAGLVHVRDPLAGVVVLDVNGVGYQMLVSVQTLADVPAQGEPCQLWVHTHVREDVLDLFGFAKVEERRAFRLLVSVPQVGPKLALSVLGGLPLKNLLEAIGVGDRAQLQRIPGVGKKTADRIILDLLEKVGPLRDSLEGGSNERPLTSSADGVDGQRDDARAVLINLGWKTRQVDKVLEAVPGDEHDTLDDLVRRALAELMGGRG